MPFKFKVFILILLALITRFVGLNWGQGHYFHPDENNMAVALSQLDINNLNPHFFAYGQFPLYLGFFTLKLFGITNSFANSVLILRLYSALFSLFSLYFFYKIYPHLSFILLLIFTPGLIQLAHFGTTESLLIFTFSLNLYLAKLILARPKFIYFFLSSLGTALAIATKISGAIFIVPIFLASIFSRSFIFIPYLIFSLFLSALLSPYSFLAFSDFTSAMKYETSVATGTLPVFYTTQFSHGLPYLFQLFKVFPYANGWPLFLFTLLSLPFIKISKLKKNPYIWIIFFSSLLYFLYFGQLYVKWTRFMSPLFFLLPLLATPFLRRFPKFIPLALLPGLFFFSTYFFTDTRLLASNYLFNTLSQTSFLLSESGNVVNLPLSTPSFAVENYDFYNDYQPKTLAKFLEKADYILIPSRRVFKNYSYPYYQHLFDGSLGFQLIKTFSPSSDFFLNPENAEETWSVFDRPTLRLYQKVTPLTLTQYEDLL